MKKDVVKYNNDLNSVSFKGFNEKELDLFFAICYKAKEKGTDIIELNFSELNKLMCIEKNTNRLKNYVVSLNKKLLSLNYTVVTKSKIDSFVFFTRLSSNFDTGKIEIVINEPFKHLLNDLLVTYTKFDLLDFVELKSVYSKNLFRLLKQWESTKVKEFEIEDFKNILGVPKGYLMHNIDKRVLKPIIEELPSHFPNLKLEKIKSGKNITSLKFTWKSKVKKKEAKKTDEVIEIIEVSEHLNNAIEKAKNNRFIKNLLTIDNIEILSQMFIEKDLVKGLLWAYKEVKQEIASLNYLIKTIRTGIEKKEKQLIIKKSEEKQEEFKIEKKEIKIEFEQTVIKTKVTQNQYDNLYKEHLKKFNAEDNKFMKLAFDSSNHNKFEIIEEEKTIEFTEEQLLSKSGKKLVGGALEARKQKLIRELKKD